jgi:hypothetical protein
MPPKCSKPCAKFIVGVLGYQTGLEFLLPPPDGCPARAAGASRSQRDGKGGAPASPGHVGGIQGAGRGERPQGCISPQRPPHPAAWILVFSHQRSLRPKPEPEWTPRLMKTESWNSAEFPETPTRCPVVFPGHWLLFDTALTWTNLILASQHSRRAWGKRGSLTATAQRKLREVTELQ